MHKLFCEKGTLSIMQTFNEKNSPLTIVLLNCSAFMIASLVCIFAAFCYIYIKDIVINIHVLAQF